MRNVATSRDNAQRYSRHNHPQLVSSVGAPLHVYRLVDDPCDSKFSSKTSYHDQTGAAGQPLLRKPTAGHDGFSLLTSSSVSLTHASEVPLDSGCLLSVADRNVPESRDFKKHYVVTAAVLFVSNAKSRFKSSKISHTFPLPISKNGSKLITRSLNPYLSASFSLIIFSYS